MKRWLPEMNQLHSGSFNQTFKVYGLSPSIIDYVETLFDHNHVRGPNDQCGETCKEKTVCCNRRRDATCVSRQKAKQDGRDPGGTVGGGL